MATFTEYTDILPDPGNYIDNAGSASSSNTGASLGVGFKSVSFTSNAPIMRDRTNSGRLLTRSQIYHKWEIKVSYNPMTEAQFRVVNSFLIARQGTLKPFFIKLPQYGAEVDLTCNAALVGASQIITTNAVADPSVGSLFTVTDSNNSNHTKSYMITTVENATDHNTTVGALTGNQKRITFTPGLQKAVSASQTLELSNPLMKVIQTKNQTSYSLDQNNLYNLSLTLEEVTT